MKCKNWSNKLNNFVVRKLKSFKINGQQQVLSSTMPAMPKEKQTTPISLDENSFDEIKMKEQLNISNTSAVSTASSVPRLLRRCSSNNLQEKQQCCCKLDDCCPILTTSTATGSIQDNATINSSVKENSSKINSQNCCGCQQNQEEQRQRCNCNSLNGDSSSTSSSSVITNQLYNVGKTMDILDYKSSIRGYLNPSSSTYTSPTTSTTCSTIISSSSCILPTTSSSSTASSSSTSTASSLSTAKNIGKNVCNCSKNSKQYNYINGGESSNKYQFQSTQLNTICNNDRDCSLNTTAHATEATSSLQNTNFSPASSAAGRAQHQQIQPPKKTPNDFIFEKYLGEGSFSTVYHAKEVRTKKEVAIKVCEKTHIIREKKQEYVKREREVMHRMSNCPGFVNLYCTFQDESRLYFVMTFAKNGDLLPHINKVGSFDFECTQHYAAELVLACENMHKRGIVHRDLKPENILLDDNMHTLIADFGSAKIMDNNSDMCGATATTSSQSTTELTSATATVSSSTLSASSSSSSSTTAVASNSSPINSYANRRNNYRLHNDVENEEAQTRSRRRRCSFVGTAQYVSPELLQDGQITPACDLWALGCILYQMISGLPPFRGNTEFLIFKQILNLNLEFPDGFDKNAEDLVRNLLKLNPEERLGAQDKIGCYESIRTHPFFDGINWDAIRIQTPPTIYPYLPGANKEDELRSQYRVPDNLEPGLNDKQLTRLLGLGLMGIEMGDKTEPKNNFNLTDTEMRNRLDAQKADKWSAFADGELILKKGFVNKRKGLFARKRMLLLLTGPKLVYIDPVAMIKKGEIPWSPELRVEPKNFKIFFVHTPNRTYYLEDPDGYALKWVNAIENVRQQTYSSISSPLNMVPH